ncbi:MAG: hypothetical protein HWN65_09970 [Candidatus Helarchaeota archaeon]|nr:hypothetical protein [Candidatus Helarchaeota archaeon]
MHSIYFSFCYSLLHYRFKCYGLKKYKKFYIPLSKGASKLLDYLKEGWETTGDVEFELVTLARILDLKGGFSSISERERISAFEVPSYREELVSHNLIEDLGTHPVSVRITEKGLKYFTWNSNNLN